MRFVHRILLLTAFLGASPCVAGDVTGQVTIAVEGVPLAEVGPVVVFLDGGDGAASAFHDRRRVTIRQRNAHFDPDFLVIPAGQDVEMPNDDTIFHNVFSFSRPNDFDLGIYPAGESRTVVFRHAGLVRIYCSIHESMSAGVLVTPTRWFASAARSGAYRIDGVPEGRYQLTVWNEKLPTVTRWVDVGAEGTTRADVSLGSAAP